MENMLRRVNEFMTRKVIATKAAVGNNRGEGYIDTAIKDTYSCCVGSIAFRRLIPSIR